MSLMTTKETAIAWLVLIISAQFRMEHIIEPGPSSGIMLQDAPGFLLTEKRVFSQKICVALDPRLSIERNFNVSHLQLAEVQTWYADHIVRAQSRVRSILEQARKPFITHSMSTCSKGFAGLLNEGLVFHSLGMVVSTATSVVNSISLKTLQAEMCNLRENIELLHQAMETHNTNMEKLTEVVNNIIVTKHVHSESVSHSTKLHQRLHHERFKYELLSIKDPIKFHTLMFINEVQNGLNDLLKGRVPLYFVSRDMIKRMLLVYGEEATEELYISLSFKMGSAVPLYIDPERMEICFLLSIPYITTRDVFQMKYVHNVGTYQNGFHVKIQTPEVVAYQFPDTKTLSVPMLSKCVKFKDIHFQCYGKPFVYDVSQELCGMSYLRYGSEKCTVVISKIQDNSSVQATLVGNKWLVSTTEKEANIYYKDFIKNKKVPLPTPVIMVNVPKDSKVVIGDITLYYVGEGVWESEVQIVDAFQGHMIPMDPDLKFLLDHKPNQTIELLVRKNNLTIHTLKYSQPDKQLLATNIGMDTSVMVLSLLALGLIIWLVIITKQVKQLRANADNLIPMAV